MSPELRFGAQAGDYRAFRPLWPAELFTRVLTRVAGERRRALDLGAGTGLVARVLAEHFAHVLAVEPDERMRAEFEPRANVTLLAARAEDVEVELASCDLVTIGNAFHWMDGARVCVRAYRWLRPGGTFAVFRYNPPHSAEGALDALLAHEFTVTWRAHVHARLLDPEYALRTLSESIFGARLEASWLPNELSLSRDELLGFLRSTSYGGGHARALAEPEAYWRELEARIVAAAGDGPYRMDFGVELLLGARI